MGYTEFKLGSLYQGEHEHVIMHGLGSIATSDEFWGSDISIRDCGECIHWTKPDGMNILIADNVILVGVKWDLLHSSGFTQGNEISLSGNHFLCRLPSTAKLDCAQNEWVAALNETSVDNDFWHWADHWFWTSQGKVGGDCVVLGKHGPSAIIAFRSHTSNNQIGFRPVLDILPVAPDSKGRKVLLDGEAFKVTQLNGIISPKNLFYPQLTPCKGNPFAGMASGSCVRMYTLLADGKPVPQLEDGYVDLPTSPKLELTDKFFGDEYLIDWCISNGTAVASKPLLSSKANQYSTDTSEWQRTPKR